MRVGRPRLARRTLRHFCTQLHDILCTSGETPVGTLYIHGSTKLGRCIYKLLASRALWTATPSTAECQSRALVEITTACSNDTQAVADCLLLRTVGERLKFCERKNRFGPSCVWWSNQILPPSTERVPPRSAHELSVFP